ncbi:hypothetical protein [Mycoplasma miroungirhinis]|uniref:Uncharacterized protein n=1 Tax=Mycoplasma miroungirhinis TaxID=754516 RepID=A0A6M4JD84_9MOLU|nr:hypothetical protein [Mycoplasma miroungirhinis]QJR44218.1 hypothetical protein HLA92_02105 [Mycoplasma miroungirhinis]
MEDKKASVSYDYISVDPIKNFYEKTVYEIYTYVDKFLELRYKQINDKIDAKVELKLKQIKMHREDIAKKEKSLSVKWKDFANSVIFVLFFFLIGFAFWKIYQKNKKVLKEFYSFSRNEEMIIDGLKRDKQKLLYKIFNSFSLNDVKKFVLAEMGIYKVNNNDFNEVLNNIQIKNSQTPTFFRHIEKYDIRNNFFYDVDFYNINYSIQQYSGSRVVAYTADGKIYKQTVIAYYSHPVPNLNQTHLTIYLTNYLPQLTFRSIQTLPQKELKKLINKNKFILENKDIYTKYNFAYNDELSFVNFFQLITQNNYIKWYDYAKPLNIFNPHFEKTSTGFIVYNKNYKYYNNVLKNTSQWFLNLVSSKDPETLSIDDIKKEIIYHIYTYIEDIISNLTLVFLNKYLASETYTENKQFSFDYSDKQNIENKASEIQNDLFFINKLNKNKYFTLKTEEPARDCIYDSFKKEIVGNGIHFINLEQWSWYIEEKIKTVKVDSKAGWVSVDVYYDDYIKFSESKTIIFSPNFKLKDEQFINSLINDKDDAMSIYETKDKQLIYTVSQHKLYWNFNLNDDSDRLNDAIEIIKDFNNLFKEYRKFYSLEIDSEGVFVFINEPNAIPKNITLEMLSFINNI